MKQKSTNQSSNAKFVGCHYMTRPGTPTVVSGTHDQKVHSWVSSWMYWCFFVMKVGRVFQATGPE